MAQLPYIEPAQADPLTKAVYDKVQARFRMVLNIFKITVKQPYRVKGSSRIVGSRLCLH